MSHSLPLNYNILQRLIKKKSSPLFAINSGVLPYYQAFVASNSRGQEAVEWEAMRQVDMGQMSQWLGLICDDSLCKPKQCCNFNQLRREVAA